MFSGGELLEKTLSSTPTNIISSATNTTLRLGKFSRRICQIFYSSFVFFFRKAFSIELAHRTHLFYAFAVNRLALYHIVPDPHLVIKLASSSCLLFPYPSILESREVLSRPF
jgi:hypothetical protein